MGTGVTLLGDMQHLVLMPVVAINMLVLLFLIDHATESYLVSMKSKQKQALTIPEEKQKQDSHASELKLELEFEHARLRLEIFWTVVVVGATASALKIVLPHSLADQIIAAWFVGQGFALQPYVQSVISGISIRGNKHVWESMMDKHKPNICIGKDKYTLLEHNVFNLTLTRSETVDEDVITILKVLQWQNIAQYTVESR